MSARHFLGAGLPDVCRVMNIRVRRCSINVTMWGCFLSLVSGAQCQGCNRSVGELTSNRGRLLTVMRVLLRTRGAPTAVEVTSGQSPVTSERSQTPIDAFPRQIWALCASVSALPVTPKAIEQFPDGL